MTNRDTVPIWFSMIFVLAFGIAGGVMMGISIRSFVKIGIAKNGTPAQAEIIAYDSNTSVNEVPYYYYEYVFEVEGNFYYGKSSSNYTYGEVKNKIGQIIEIRYNSNFVSCPADYKFGGNDWILPLMSLPFSAVSIGFIIYIIKSRLSKLESRRIERTGRDAVARIVDVSCGLTVNDVPYYKLKYEFEGMHGEICYGKTRSVFNEDEAEYFRQTRKANIRVDNKGKSTVILRHDDVEDFFSANPQVNMPQEDFSAADAKYDMLMKELDGKNTVREIASFLNELHTLPNLTPDLLEAIELKATLKMNRIRKEM